jgi:hypothetical protein
MAIAFQQHPTAGNCENRAPVAELYCESDERGPSNVAVAQDAEGNGLFNFAYRPHHKDQDYTDEHGLFFC